MKEIDPVLSGALDALASQNLLRRLRLFDGAQHPEAVFDGGRVVHFSSNDYLGLAADPLLREAAMEALEKYGAGSGASRLLSGTMPPHAELESALAEFKGTEAALAFSCGYSTALGTIPALVGPRDVVILDKLAHACLVDGARLSGATIRVFPHNDAGRLEHLLKKCRESDASRRILIVTESVFSMDGDLAPLAEIVALKEKFGAWLLLDEAHGVGVLGNHGRGLADALGLGQWIEIQMGTLGKAFGAAGGYIAGSKKLVEYLINRARSFIFSTAPPPCQAAAAAAAVRFLQSAEGTARITALSNNRILISKLLPEFVPTTAPSAIVPIPVGDEGMAVRLASHLLGRGFFIPAVRYPTVARKQARLRLTLTASHTPSQLEAASAALREAVKNQRSE